MTWTAPTPDAFTSRPLTGADRPILEGMLDWHRHTLHNICAGLTAEQMASRPIASTNLTLLGLVRHMAKVERVWFRKRVAAEPIEHLHRFDAHDDTDFNVLDAAEAPAALALLADEQAAASRSVAGLDLDLEIINHGAPMSLRMVHVHMIGEYARHNGHADLLREGIDGVVGR